MMNAHRRSKQPEQVRQQLLAVTGALAAEAGLAGLTLDAVAAAAGVSKGGLLHHFPNKAALIDGLFARLLSEFEAAVEAAMACDVEPVGRYSRAYVAVCFDLDQDAAGAGWRVLTIALLAEPALKGRWQAFVTKKAERHAETDGSAGCLAARFAADGLWLADMLGSHRLEPPERQALKARLMALTTA
ncbi:transcriptional regulator, TetR family [Rhizobium sp. RU20A]|uniref:TetR/AcrR family transcriptional regulator n=1 Tax=Rhizobium sp. RU20A TaxID=1907412 RepID=UPI0009553508|nr:TetR family transcriptional regulator [Rhizobium sp. RU20A]SIQ30546.1 transcriptional regulator, TetR family [Rhizobium sp. RU20A]